MGILVRSGDLRHKITFEARINISDGMGGVRTIWKPVITSISAAIWAISAKEQIQASQVVMTVTHRVRIRYIANINSSYRIKYGKRYFNIVSIINPDEKNKMLELLCKEVS